MVLSPSLKNLIARGNQIKSFLFLKCHILKIIIYFCITGLTSQIFQSANIIILRIYMNIIDAIILICLIPALVQGLRKGFISQAISIISLIVGIWASAHFAGVVTEWISQYITASEQVLNIIAFAVILIIAFVVLGLTGRLLESILDFVFLGWVNKLLGTVFSLMKTCLILGLIAMVINSICAAAPDGLPEAFKTSTLYPVVTNIAESIFPYIKNLLTLK